MIGEVEEKIERQCNYLEWGNETPERGTKMIYDSWREQERGHLVEVEVNLMLGTISYDKDRDIKKYKVSKKITTTRSFHI